MYKDHLPLQDTTQAYIQAFKYRTYQAIYNDTGTKDGIRLLSIMGILTLCVNLPNGRVVFCRIVDGRDIAPNAIQATKGKNKLRVRMETSNGTFEVDIETGQEAGLNLHYAVRFTPKEDVLIDDMPADLLILKRSSFSPAPEGEAYAEQMQIRSGIAFVDFGKSTPGCLFYFQNLGALNDYAEDVQVSLADTVKIKWPELGYTIPVSSTRSLRKGKKYILKDTFVLYHSNKPKDKFDVASSYLRMQEIVYRKIDRPTTKVQDYEQYLANCIADLYTYKGCWEQVEAQAYLNAYVSDYENPVEIMVQLAVLIPLLPICKKAESAKLDYIADTLIKTIPHFFDPKIKTFIRWLPKEENRLDGSEEQKEPRIMDSWYLHHPLLAISHLVRDGHVDEKIKDMFFQSVDYSIRVARNFKYKWPIFYDMDTLEVVKKEAGPGEGGEKDVAGMYAQLMLRAYELSKKKKYIDEAVRAVTRLRSYEHDILYQANNSSYAAEALLELWAITKQDRYLDLSVLFMSNILRNTSLWDRQYGSSKKYPNFFALFPLTDAPYSAVFEEHECLASAHRYLQMAYAYRAPLPEGILALLPEYVKYACQRIPYYFPPLLPADILAPEVKSGYLDKDLWMPVEDLGDGWEPVGQVGQEVYGAGALFNLVNRHFFDLDKDTRLFLEYPAVEMKRLKNSLSFRLTGIPAYSCRVWITGPSEKEYQLEVHEGEAQKEVIIRGKSTLLKGGTRVTIHWG